MHLLKHSSRQDLHLVVVTYDNSTLKKLLSDKVGDIKAQDECEETVLYLAVSYNNMSVFQTLIQAGANIDIQNNEKHTPLHETIISNRLEMVNILL